MKFLSSPSPLGRLASIFAIALAGPLHAGEFKFGNQILKVPDGFEIELVTTTNLVKRPVTMSFDEQGRLYVTDSSGSSEKGPTQYEQHNHRVMRLEDTDGDGKFDKSTTFADNMMFPEGCLYYDGSVYVGAPPSIWKLTDTNSDGVADVRVEWHKGLTLTGCANDLHGPYLGPDGWIYWCKGAFSNQTYEVNGKPWSSRAAHIFRARPDHTGIEPVLTGGMDNPVAVAFSPEGERFLAGTFFEPGIPGRRDGVIHAIYGGVYGKNHPDVLDAHKKTGDLMPVMIHLGASASCDLMFYRSKIFGDDFQNNMLVANFNLHNVTRHILEPDGATFKTKDSVFLSCDNDPDFHPTCVLEDADGSLLVIDTGGWYKICCPTSQLYKPDVLGAIYRIRKKGAPKVEDARGLKIEWAKLKPTELANLLSDQRVFVQQRAIHELSQKGESAIPALKEVLLSAPKPKPTKGWNKKQWHDEYYRIDAARKTDWPNGAAKRENALWALTRIESPSAREAVRLGFKDIDEGVRAVAFQSASLHRDKKAAEISEPISDIFVILNEERLYFELLGRTKTIGNLALHHIRSLIDEGKCLLPSDYRVLQHSFSFALIETDSAKVARDLLKASNLYLDIRPAVLIGLDQMDSGDLKPSDVLPLFSSEWKYVPDYRSTALWIIGHHPEWGGSLAGFFRDQLATNDLSASDQGELQNLLAQFANDASVQGLLATTARDSKSKETRLIALRAMSRAQLKEAPKNWADVLRMTLGESDEAILRASVAAVHAFTSLPVEKRPNMIPALLKVACNEKIPEDLRVEAFAAMPPRRGLDEVSFSFLTANLDPQKPSQQRNNAASVLGREKLDDRQLTWLAAEEIKRVGPMEVLKLLPAFDRSTNETVGLKLIESLKESKAAASLRAETLTNHIARFPESVKKKADEFLASLNTDAEAQKKNIDELLVQLKDGDIRHGQAVFNGVKAACSTCHAIGYQGGHVGPDLTKIGTVRTERDLLEAIVYPSATFVRSYEPMIVSTKNDEDYNGILKKDAADEIILVTGPNAEVRVARNDIREMRPGAVSVMPQGLDTQLTKQELADLVAFLKATRW